MFALANHILYKKIILRDCYEKMARGTWWKNNVHNKQEMIHILTMTVRKIMHDLQSQLEIDIK